MAPILYKLTKCNIYFYIPSLQGQEPDTRLAPQSTSPTSHHSVKEACACATFIQRKTDLYNTNCQKIPSEKLYYTQHIKNQNPNSNRSQKQSNFTAHVRNPRISELLRKPRQKLLYVPQVSSGQRCVLSGGCVDLTRMEINCTTESKEKQLIRNCQNRQVFDTSPQFLSFLRSKS